MTDPDDEQSAIGAPPERCKIRGEASIRPDLIAVALQNSKGGHNLDTFRALINIKTQLKDPKDSAVWNRVIVVLLRIISSSDDVGCEQVLLASLALVNVLFRTCNLEDFTRQLMTYWKLEVPALDAWGKQFEIRDVEWFKLAMTHGYLRANIKTIYPRDTMSVPFELLRRNCLRYTKYSYFAHKTLQSWLEKTATTNFWCENDVTSMEKDLEAIIYSNWDSSILEIARINSTQIFPTYLRIMSAKYEGFSNFIFDNCMENLSWQNELKYTILAEVCKISDDVPKILSSDLPSCLFTSLTKNHLKYPGTKLYLTILGQLKPNEWQEIFGPSLFRVSAIWESEQQETAIDLLWEQWMKPTIVKFPNVFEFLWNHHSMTRLKLSRSYLEKIGDRHGFKLIYEATEIREILINRVIDISEPVRLNAFAIICQLENWKIAINATDPFATLKRFFFFNVDTSSIYMRKGIVKNFEILFANMVKMAESDSTVEHHVHDFFRWFHEFLLDCFELGASYQRKILALSLYEIVLIPTSSDDCRMGIWNANNCKRERRKFIDCAKNLRIKMSDGERWLYCDSRSTRIIYSLVYDPINEVRDKAAFIVIQYMCKDVFPTEELEFCWTANEDNCRSSSFHDIEIGATVEKIRTVWSLKTESAIHNDRLTTIRDHIQFAREQLRRMQEHQDILYCLQSRSPVYGSLMVILEVGFLIGPADKIYDESTVRKILYLAEDVTKFFLLALSPGAREINCSSSFNDMARAIETSIRNSGYHVDDESVSSSAYQIFLSCVWMSLKVSCEIAAELGLIAETIDTARRSVELIVSVLLKCRHKGAIEAAGLALAKLTKSLSRGKYSALIESHLTELLNIGNEDNINLTRRGAGMTIMLHRIVSSDGRRNKPWLHLAVRKLLDSLTVDTDDAQPMQTEDCLVDSTKARHLHFLRSLVADKELQTQLLPYIEDICLTCFEYLQSPEWTVRNASLQLFGAIVPRLVGQCSARELDYGIGNSVEHFITHYPILAEAIIAQLNIWKHAFDHQDDKNYNVTHFNSNIVAVLTLLSKMSLGGCELVDFTSKSYSSEARKAFRSLFNHPVSNVRILAGKAYAAYVALPEIPRKIAKLQRESLSSSKNEKSSNLAHGQLCAQLYLVRKLKHESQCTSENFHIRNDEKFEEIVNRGSYSQLRLLYRIIRDWTKWNKQICYTVVTTLIECLLESPIDFYPKDLPLHWMNAHIAMGKMIGERSKPGFAEFLDKLMRLSVRIRVVHENSVLSNIFNTETHCPEHRIAIVKHLRHDRWNLEIFVDEAEANLINRKKFDNLTNVVASIRDTIYNDPTKEKLPKKINNRIKNLSEKLRKDDDVIGRPYGLELRNDGYCIALKLFKFHEIFEETIDYVMKCIYEADEATKKMSIDCLKRVVTVFGDNFKTIGESRGSWYKLVPVVIALLTDDDHEIRESVARIIHPIARSFVDATNDEPICARACYHKILYNLSVATKKMTLTEWYEVSSVLSKLLNNVRFHVAPEGLRNLYQQTDTFNPDTSFVNLLFYCARTFMKKNLTVDSWIENVEMQSIDGTVRAKYEIQRSLGLDFDRLEFIFNLETSEYLTMKKAFLIKFIDMYKHETHCYHRSMTMNRLQREILG